MWIESHQEIAQHPKTKRLARRLGISVPTAIGHLHLLWWWSVDYADDGDLSRYTPEDIADAMMWEGEPQDLWDALVELHWIDLKEERPEIHDWDTYIGRLLEKRRKDAERKRESRDRTPPAPPTSNGHTTDTPKDIQATAQVTVPNRTVPISPLPPSGEGGGPKRRAKRVGHEPITEPEQVGLVEKYAERYGGEPAVLEEISAALNHNARFKCLSERLYVDNWLRRELQHRPTRMMPTSGRNGQYRAPPESPSPPRQYIDVSGFQGLNIKGRGNSA